jgi:hypothetical protein
VFLWPDQAREKKEKKNKRKKARRKKEKKMTKRTAEEMDTAGRSDWEVAHQIVVKWDKAHRVVVRTKYSGIPLLCKQICTHHPVAVTFFDLYDKINKSMCVGGNTQLIGNAIDMAVQTIPFAMTRTREGEMEKAFEVVAHKAVYTSYATLGDVRWNLLSLKPDPSASVLACDARYILCTVFAFLWIAAKNAISDKDRFDATYACARFMGEPFTNFVHMLITFNLLCNFLPATLHQLLEWYIADLDVRHRGQLPDFDAQPNKQVTIPTQSNT